MALTNYTTLQASIVSWLWDRSDLTAVVPDFIALFEADCNHELRVRQMEAQATITLTNGTGSLPADYLTFRTVYASSDPVRSLEAVDPDWAISQYPETTATDPLYFYIMGSSIYTKPVCSSTLTMLYYQRIPALATASTNWLLTASPNCYLYGSLVHASPFLDDDQRVQTWTGLRNEAFGLLRQSDVLSKFNRARMRIRGAVA